MNSYQVRAKNYSYNDVVALIYANSIGRANELCIKNEIDLYEYEVNLEQINIKNELGKPYPEKFEFLNS
jgi:hypothetical protein